MALVHEQRAHPDELRADLQRVYGIDLDHAMRGEHSPMHVAALVSQLPQDSRIRVVDEPDAEWTLTAVLLASILNALRGLMWGMSDKRRRGPQPKPVGPSWMTGTRSLQARAMPLDELLAELGKPRR